LTSHSFRVGLESSDIFKKSSELVNLEPDTSYQIQPSSSLVQRLQQTRRRQQLAVSAFLSLVLCCGPSPRGRRLIKRGRLKRSDRRPHQLLDRISRIGAVGVASR